MEIAVKAAGWVVGKALGPVTDSLLQTWADSKGLGPNMDALKVELLYAQGLLENAEGWELRSPALKELLHRMRQLAYNADDVLDEVDYFRIEDALLGTYYAADEHKGGCVANLLLHASATADAVAAKLKPSCCSRSRDAIRVERGEQDDEATEQAAGCLSTIYRCGRPAVIIGGNNGFFCGALPSKVQGCLSRTRLQLCGNRAPACGCLLPNKVTSTAKSIGKRLLCCSFQSVNKNAHTSMLESPNTRGPQTPELKFNRAEISEKMKKIIESLKPVCANVSNILNLEFMGTNRITRKDIAKKRPITTSDITDNELYGRDIQKKRIVDAITRGEYCANSNGIVVLPIVGPGGIGKTTFTQHISKEVKSQFDVYIWICVSLDFNATRLSQEAVNQIPIVADENKNSRAQDLIKQRLKGKRFLLVLDDMWECREDEWKRLLAPFGRGGEKGSSMVIVTTRFPKVAKDIKSVEYWIELKQLEAKDFMRLFETCIFGGQKPWEGHEKLLEIGTNIVSKLKRFPLEAKTVGRLLRDQLTTDHWTRILESKEWDSQTNDDDIMPALKLSYDYLPFHLQQCFYYCALFPEDYAFQSKELVHFWIGLDIIHPSHQNKTIEDVGMVYLEDLVNYGFLKKDEKNSYVLHDLLHNLAVKVSSFECLSINSSNVKSIQIPQDVRHLSIIVENKDVEDIKAFKFYKNDLSALQKRLKFENLRTLIVFGEHHGSFVKIFCDLLGKASALRAIYLSEVSYSVEELLCNFSKLIHLRYLRIKSKDRMENTDFLSALSRLYHLEVIDLQECTGPYGFIGDMSNLAKLRHFLVPEGVLEPHFNIAEVGKLTSLQELSFVVRDYNESKGFELCQLGQMSELGSLAILSLERIRAVDEVSEVRLVEKKCLRKLKLEWHSYLCNIDALHQNENIDPTQEGKVMDNLMPHSNLQDLCIRGNGGSKCPQWLGENLSVKYLESLHLECVAWKSFPPLGELWVVTEPHGDFLRCFRRLELIKAHVPDTKFQNLRNLEITKLHGLKKWVVNSCQLFALLEVLTITHCSRLEELSFSHSTCCQQEKEAHMNWFPCLKELNISDCPQLISFPPVPWTSTPCSVRMLRVGFGYGKQFREENHNSEHSLDGEWGYGKQFREENHSSEHSLDNEGRASLGFGKLFCFEKSSSEYILDIEGTDNLDIDSMFSKLLAFDNLTKLNGVTLTRCSLPPLHHLQKLSSLKTLKLQDSRGSVFPLVGRVGHTEYQFPIECIDIVGWDASAKELTRLLTCCSELSELAVICCEKAKELGVVVEMEKQEATATTGPSRKGGKIVPRRADMTKLLLPSRLRKLLISSCRNLSLTSNNPVDYISREAGRNGGAQGLQGLSSLQHLSISGCPRFLSSSSPCFPFPTSLEHLSLDGVDGMETLLPLSELSSLAHLSISECGNLRGEGLRALLAHGRLTELIVRKTPNFFAGSEPSLPHEPEFPSTSPSPSFKLQSLRTDDVAGVLAAPVWTLLSSSLTCLGFEWNQEVERFTEEQEEALRHLNYLEQIRFSCCDKLQCIPAGLHGLPNLKILEITSCEAILSLPNDGLLSSLQELNIHSCKAIRSVPKECLPNSLQKLVIWGCPAIRSLPKVEDLPSSLRELDISLCESEELTRQCRKLIGTIPIVKA